MAAQRARSRASSPSRSTPRRRSAEPVAGPSNAAAQDALSGAELDGAGEVGAGAEWGAAAAQDADGAARADGGARDEQAEASPDDPEVLQEADKPRTREAGRKKARRGGGREREAEEDGGPEAEQEPLAAGAPAGQGRSAAAPSALSLTAPTAALGAAPAVKEAPAATVVDAALQTDFLDQASLHTALAEGDLDSAVQIDRDALLGETMGQGLGQGAMGAGINLAADTGLDVATSKIPFVSGFIELGKMAMDPKGWVADIVEGYTGSVGSMSELDMTSGADIGKVADFMEGVLAVLSGASHTVSLITMVLTIAASICFGLCWIPGLQFLAPIAAFLTTWAVLLGTIGTVMGLFVTAMHAVLMNLRIAELKTSDDDPSALLDAADSIEEHASSFAGGAVQRAGGGLRDRAQKKLESTPKGGDAGKAGSATATAADVVAQTPSKDAPKTSTAGKVGSAAGTLANTAVNGLTGAVGGGGRTGKGKAFQGGAKGGIKGIGKQAAKTRDVTKAMFGKGKAGRQGGRGFRETMSRRALDMEAAGATVYVGDGHRRRMTRGKGKLTDYAERRSMPKNQGALDPAQARELQAELDRHNTVRNAHDEDTLAAVRDQRQGAHDRLHAGLTDTLKQLGGPQDDHDVFSHQAMGSGATGWGSGFSGLGAGIMDGHADRQQDERAQAAGTSPVLTAREQEALDNPETKAEQAGAWLDKAGLSIGYLDPDYAEKSIRDVLDEREGPDRKTLVKEAMQAESTQLTAPPAEAFAVATGAPQSQSALELELAALVEQHRQAGQAWEQAAGAQEEIQAQAGAAASMQAAAAATQEGLDRSAGDLAQTRAQTQADAAELEAEKQRASELASSGMMKMIIDAQAKLSEMGGLGDKAKKEGGEEDGSQAGEAPELSALIVSALDASAQALDQGQADGIAASEERSASAASSASAAAEQQAAAERNATENAEAMAMLEDDNDRVLADMAAVQAAQGAQSEAERAAVAEVEAWARTEHPAQVDGAEANLQVRFPWLSLRRGA